MKWLCLSLGCLVLASASPARADGEPDPAALTLFRSGRALVAAGNWDAGCDKMEQSLKRYAAAVTLLNVARCDEHFGRWATAWSRYERALVIARGEREARADLIPIAEEGARRLLPKLPRLLVRIETAAAVATVTVRGKEFPIDDALPLDPGAYIVVVRAPGYADEIRAVQIEEGRTEEMRVALKVAATAAPILPMPRAPLDDAGRKRSGVSPWIVAAGGVGFVLGGAAVAIAVDAQPPDALRGDAGTVAAVSLGVASVALLVTAAYAVLAPQSPSATTAARN